MQQPQLQIPPIPSGQVDLLPQLQAGYPLSRQRHHLIRTARGRTGIIFGSRPLIPASSVPEELIEQVRIRWNMNCAKRVICGF